MGEELDKEARRIYTKFGATAITNFMRNDPQGGPRSPLDMGPLRIVSGRLAKSMNGSVNGNEAIRRMSWAGVRGRIGWGSRVPYAAIHENGGVQRVQPHDRVISQVFGKPIEPKAVKVRGHIRLVPARPYANPAVEANMGFTKEAVRKAFVRSLVRASA